jgi:hemerythrin-like domain-containing protein
MDTHASVEPQSRADLVLPGHHRRIEALLNELSSEVYGDDSRALCALWTRFERELDAHIEAEEHHLLPAFARTHGHEADALHADHLALRKLVAELGLAIDLHQLRAEVAERLIARLREHARREDAVLYPWAARHEMTLPDHLVAILRGESGESEDALDRARQQLAMLIDQMRLKLHLATMEAKDAFATITHEASQLGRQAERTSGLAAQRLIERLRSLARETL